MRPDPESKIDHFVNTEQLMTFVPLGSRHFHILLNQEKRKKGGGQKRKVYTHSSCEIDLVVNLDVVYICLPCLLARS